MKNGDIVKYAQPDEGEEDFRFAVVEMNGDRASIVCVNSGLDYPPVETVRVADIEELKRPGGVHTPGPWMDCGSGIIDVADGRSAIATRVVEAKDWGRIFEVYDYSNEPEANFRLILAAPELLAAMQDIFAQCAMTHKHWGDGDNNKQADAAVARARAAIKAAKGE